MESELGKEVGGVVETLAKQGAGLEISGLWKDPATTVMGVAIILASMADIFSGQMTWSQWLKGLPLLLQGVVAGKLMLTNSKK